MSSRPRPSTPWLRAAALALALAVAPAPSAAFELHADDWARPRTAAEVAAMPAVREAVRAWMVDPEQVLEIRYPGGEAGTLWADELRDWLIALGVPGDSLSTLAGSAAFDRIELVLRPRSAVR